jgi:hypothetical protein
MASGWNVVIWAETLAVLHSFIVAVTPRSRSIRCNLLATWTVVTTAITPPDEEVKVYRGMPLLTGVGAEELADQIASDLKA